MTAGAGTPAEHSGVRDAPGATLGHGPVRRIWQRWHLVPLCILMVAVIVATIAGLVQRDRLTELQYAAPVEVITTGESLPAACTGPAIELPDHQPWLGQARVSSEQLFQTNWSGAQMFVEGRDGWVFWNDIQAGNFSQALGRRVLSQAEMDGWYAAFSTLHDRLAEQNIDLVIQVVPAKWSIYPQQLPAWTDSIRGATTLDYIRYAHPGLPVMDMRAGLRAAAQQNAVYTPLNSHWTRYGGAAGWGLLAGCLTAVDAERYAGLAPLAMAGVDLQPERNEFEPFGYAAQGALDPVPMWADAPGIMNVTKNDGSVVQVPTDTGVDMLELPATTVTQQPQSQASAVIFRDSQGNNIGAGWQAGFATTWQYPHNLDKPDQPVDFLEIAQQHHPDVVIIEVTERHLNFVPPLTY